MIPLGMGLLERAQGGDSRAFEQLIRPHLSTVRRFAFAFAKNWHDADDLAQEALIKAYRALGSFEGKSSLSTWLYAVTRNTCHDYYRGRLSRTREFEEDLNESVPDLDDDQETLLLAKASAEQLWAAIHELPAEFKSVVVWCDVEGLSYDEVARVENVPIGTVRSRLSRARARLKRLLTEEGSLAPTRVPHLRIVRTRGGPTS